MLAVIAKVAKAIKNNPFFMMIIKVDGWLMLLVLNILQI